MNGLRVPTTTSGRGAVRTLAPFALWMLSACATSTPPPEPVKVPPMSRPFPPKRVETPPTAPATTPDDRDAAPAADDKAVP